MSETYRGGLHRLPRPLDAVLAVLLVLLAVDGVARGAGSDWLAYVLAVLTAAPLAARQQAPVCVTLVMVSALATYSLLGYRMDEIPAGGIGMIVGMFTVATMRPWRVAAPVFAATSVITAAYIGLTEAPLWPSVAQSTLVLLGAWLLGDGTRRWARHAERLAARTTSAVSDERVRIARELHDIVSHHMSVVSLQSGLAGYLITDDPKAAKEAIGAAGDASRQALAEMRRLLDVLRVRDDEKPHVVGAARPLPGLIALDLLVERTRRAGLPVDVVISGRARPLPAGVDLCVYRTVQESLTNVLKHAGPEAAARIELDYGPDTFTLTVSDTGAALVLAGPPPAPAESGGHGIRGMRERARLYGGELCAGPREPRGFDVVLRLPITGDDR